MINLLRETLDELDQNGKETSDVLWVGDDNFKTTWENFEKIAKDCNYDNGYGGAEVYQNLKIVGKDWWLERGEYDGSEWWEFKTLPTEPKTINEMIDCKANWKEDKVWKNKTLTVEL